MFYELFGAIGTFPVRGVSTECRNCVNKSVQFQITMMNLVKICAAFCDMIRHTAVCIVLVCCILNDYESNIDKHFFEILRFKFNYDSTKWCVWTHQKKELLPDHSCIFFNMSTISFLGFGILNCSIFNFKSLCINRQRLNNSSSIFSHVPRGYFRH